MLIFAHECAPYNRPESTIGAQRPAQFAKWLPEFGWRAIVICCDAKRRRVARRADLAGIRRDTDRQLAGTSGTSSIIVRTPSLVADGPLDAAAQFFYTGYGARLPGAALVRKPLTALKLFTGDYSQSWQPCALAAAEVVARRHRVEACIGEHGPDAGIYLARRFAKRQGIPWIADFRDPALQPLPGLAAAIHKPWLKKLLRTASVTISVNPHLAALDQRCFGRPAESLPNGFDPGEMPIASREDRSAGLRVVYMGNILGPYQRIEHFLDGLAALRTTSPATLRAVSFTYVGAAADAVDKLASERRLGEVVEVLPRMERHQALEIAAAADLLLLLGTVASPDDPWYGKGVVPGKTYEYLGLRKPILCVPGDGGLLEELLLETRTGAVCKSPVEVARYLEAAVHAKSLGSELVFDPDPVAVARYTRKALTGRLAAILNRCVDNASPVAGA